MTGIIIKVALIVGAILTGLILLNSWDTLSERARGGKALQITLQAAYGQPPVSRTIPLFPEPLGRMGGLRPHECPYEDGDPSGRPCVWTDWTGKGYFVDSVEYLH